MKNRYAPAGDHRPCHRTSLCRADYYSYLLQGFDEYILEYTDRSAVLDAHYTKQRFNRPLGIDGQVVGTWKRAFTKDTVVITISSFDTLSIAEAHAIAEAATQYGAFQERPVVLA